MQVAPKKFNIQRIQWIIWTILFFIMFFVMFHEGQGILLSLAYSLCTCGCFAILIYTNTMVLIPRLWRKDKRGRYILAVLILIALLSFLLVRTEAWIKFILEMPKMAGGKIPIQLYLSTGLLNTMIFIFTLPLRFALDYLVMRQQQEELQKRTAQAELNLLKAQVQPHFLFNTLNNIYFVAQRESPTTAELLEKLSNIMRYFVDEGPKSSISLSREIAFITDYIDLEKLRMRHPLQVNLSIQGDTASVKVPPMLMIPLVENVFKHGINKRSDQNILDLLIEAHPEKLLVTVRNRLFEDVEPALKGGNGLVNLRARLQLLYQDRYTLHTDQTNGYFNAQLNIPL